LVRARLSAASVASLVLRPLSPTLFPYTTLFRSRVELQNASTGKYRSTFDVQLAQQGTYRIANVNDTIFARWDTPASLAARAAARSEEHTSESSHVKISYAVFCLKKKKKKTNQRT